ncbi:MAG: quinolinate synthase NadA [Lentisphaeria bacterium]|nr:quinolinate synthase NadA [Lentisphaeria bacterium]
MSQEIIDRIKALKVEKKAVILAHNYQLGEVQDIADFVGDSLELARKAAAVGDAEVIVFCGVHFMAETAAILSPDKIVLLPDKDAGCPMADMATGEALRKMKAEYPGCPVVCYVNSTAEVKAESDCCCTSANAVEVLKQYPKDQKIIFVPDKYLGDYAAELAERDVVLWPGYCPTHARIMPQDILNAKKAHPAAVSMTHPECPRPVRDVADHVLSTGGMLRVAGETDAKEIIVATENGMLHRLRKEFPEKTFYSVTQRAICPNMKKINLAKIMWALEDMKPVISVPEPMRSKALGSIQKMLDVS